MSSNDITYQTTYIVQELASAMENVIRQYNRVQNYAEDLTRYTSQNRLNSISSYSNDPVKELEAARDNWRQLWRIGSQSLYLMNRAGFSPEDTLEAVFEVVTAKYQAQARAFGANQWAN